MLNQAARPALPMLPSGPAKDIETVLKGLLSQALTPKELVEYDRIVLSPLLESPNLLQLHEARRLSGEMEEALFHATNVMPRDLRFLGTVDRDDRRAYSPVSHSLGSHLYDAHGRTLASRLSRTLGEILMMSTQLSPRHVLLWYFARLWQCGQRGFAKNLTPLMKLAAKALPLGSAGKKEPVWYIQTLG